MKRILVLTMLLALSLAVVAPAGADTIYSNGGGSIVGTAAVDIDSPNIVADSFVSSGPATVTGFTAGLWVFIGDTPTQLTWKICIGNPSWLGGKTLAFDDATLVNVAWGVMPAYPTMYEGYLSTVSGLNVVIEAGTYWLELSNGETTGNPYLFWDQNGGASTAYQYTSHGSYSITSNAFIVYGDYSGVPLPGAVWLLGSGLLGLAGWRRFRKS